MPRSPIRVLDRIVADQIAAGEVVERPASVVKELVENSLDAGATRVQVEIDAGGAARIRVLDNGAGLSADEIEIAFSRHATSKIERLEDLEGVASFGFRGEALPSIASVSRVAVRARTADSVAGALVELEAGEVSGKREVGCPVGADFEVRDLFYNTPARLKFLKRESTEAGRCAEALLRLAMLRPDVAFAMIANGRRTRELPRVEKVEERVAALFPDERLVRAGGSDGGVSVLAVIGPPERARAGAGSLYTYANGRFVRDRALLKAVGRAFGGTLEAGRYPVGLVSVTVPPGGVDVNVHPQKIEVRFADAQVVYRAVSRAVGEIASRSAWTHVPGDARGVAEAGAGRPASIGEGPRPAPRPYAPSPSHRPQAADAAPAGAARRPFASPLSERTPGTDREAPARTGPAEPSPPPAAAGPRFSDLGYVGQARGMFLFLEDERDLVIVDQHAAHERVTYERLREQLARGRVVSQRLLAPHAVDLGPAEADRIDERAEDLARMGLEVTRAGPDRIAVHAVPAELSGTSPDRLLADAVIALEDGRAGSRGEIEDRVLATLACHGSIRAGRALETAEVRSLLEAMDRIDFAGHCPHGRPVATRIPWREIRRRVGRE